tara:strand:+ start:814 stop:987 length:174 start_codon:yes stop_codon:yes gene_type:complete
MIEFLFKFIFVSFLSLMFTFVIINLILGCDSWNPELWNEQHSCVPPFQMLTGSKFSP